MVNNSHNIKVGDIVAAYHAGYHKVIEVKDRDGKNPLVRYIKILNADGTPIKNPKQEQSCDITFITPAKLSIERKITYYQEILDNLKKVLQ